MDVTWNTMAREHVHVAEYRGLRLRVVLRGGGRNGYHVAVGHRVVQFMNDLRTFKSLSRAKEEAIKFADKISSGCSSA